MINDIGLTYINLKLNKLPQFAFNYVFLRFLRGLSLLLSCTKHSSITLIFSVTWPTCGPKRQQTRKKTKDLAILSIGNASSLRGSRINLRTRLFIIQHITEVGNKKHAKFQRSMSHFIKYDRHPNLILYIKWILQI